MVVGGGPVGYTTALGLASHGVPVVVIEADDSVCSGSRAICISRRSLEIADRLGALPGFLEIGLPWTGGRSFYRDTEVLHFSMPQDENQKLPPMVNLAQYSIEQILLDKAETQPALIDIRWQTRVTGIEARDDGVRLTLSTPDGDYALEADWVVAADGGRSFLRDALGLKLEGTSYEGRYVIVDILLDSDRPTERLAYFDPACNPGSTVLVHKQPGNVWRIDYQLRDGEDPDAAIRPENVMPRVESLLAMMGETGAWKPIWSGIYKANALTLRALPARPRDVRRRRRAPRADLRRARRQLGHRRRRQPGLEAGVRGQGPGVERAARQLFDRARRRRAREPVATAPRAPSSWRRRRSPST